MNLYEMNDEKWRKLYTTRTEHGQIWWYSPNDETIVVHVSQVVASGFLLENGKIPQFVTTDAFLVSN